VSVPSSIEDYILQIPSYPTSIGILSRKTGAEVDHSPRSSPRGQRGTKPPPPLHGTYRSADKSLARPGRNQAIATEDFDFHISYL
jgi:hypothetical protein